MAAAASAVYFYNLRGDVLIARTYRDDVPRAMAEAFRTEILKSKDFGSSPCRTLGTCSYLWMRHENIYIVAVTNANTNAALTFKFLSETIALLRNYFQGPVKESSVRSNFVLIYELLDEIMDFGYPQNLSPEILKLYITQRATGLEALLGAAGASGRPAPPPVNATLQVTGAVGWRREGLFYKKNEVFLDIIESVNVLMKADATVLRSDVTGHIQMKCFLSGMPELKLGLNDRVGMEGGAGSKDGPGGAEPARRAATSGKSRQVELDDTVFHQCVNLGRFNAEKTVSFVPPDGEFELMKYRITEGISLPFRVLPIIKELGRTRLETHCKVRSLFGSKLFAVSVVVRVPVPPHTAKASIVVSGGKAKYVPKENALVWKIRKFPGQAELSLSAEVELIATIAEKKPWSRPPLTMDFQVPMFTSSGLRVRFLKVWEKSNYNTVKWVRYVTRAGQYEIRV
eukprot:jgi/Chlat1/6621/Chrsp482S06107